MNGSTSASFSAVPIEWKDTARSATKTPYFTHFSRWCQRGGSWNWKRPRPTARASLYTTSESAPYGQSQPQKSPRPTRNTPTITNHQNTKMNGSDRNSSQCHSNRIAWNHVSTWVTLGCALR